MRTLLRTLYYWVVIHVINPVLFGLALPWNIARFYVAWEEYQGGEVYRERLVNMGFGMAFEYFFNNKWEWNYHFQKRLARSPGLKFRIYFVPWSVRMPSTLEIASRQGYFTR